MKDRNCPNCGAPYEITKIKCPYCNTTYLDVTDACFEDGTPMYLRVRTPYINEGATILMKCIPYLSHIEFHNNETVDICGRNGIPIKQIATNREATMNMSFTAIEDDGCLFKIITEE